MIILDRKKILFVLGAIVMFIFAYTITGYNVNNASERDLKTIQTVALPVDKKVIILDARTWST